VPYRSSGVRVNAVLTAGATVRQIEHIAFGDIERRRLRATGKDAAEQLEEQFDMPYIIEELPSGIRQRGGFSPTWPTRLARQWIWTPCVQPRVAVPPVVGRRVAVIGGPTRRQSPSQTS